MMNTKPLASLGLFLVVGLVLNSLLALSALAQPTITTQPGSQTVPNGPQVTFSVTATGTGPLTYQWRKDGVDIPGATGSSYTTPLVSFSGPDVSGFYTVLVSDSSGSTTSQVATLVLTTASSVGINTPPISQTVSAGSPVTFTVISNASTYQWRKDGVDIPGATSPSYTISSVTTGDAGNYTVFVSNFLGSVTSTAATLTVSDPPPNSLPVITSHPRTQSVFEGNSATFTVWANHPSTLTYQWRKDGVDIPGATSSSFTIPVTQASDAGSYTVEARNATGPVVSNAATLSFYIPNTTSLFPEPSKTGAIASAAYLLVSYNATSLTTVVGANVYLTTYVPNPSGLNFQWQKNGINIPGATGQSYTIPSAATSDTGNYRLVVGSVMTADSYLQINAQQTITPPTIINQPISTAESLGASASFSVGISSSTVGPITYQWRKDGVAIPGATGFRYDIPAVSSGDFGNYTVVVSNSAGSVTSNTATLTQLTPPTITTQPVSQTVNTGSPFTLTVTASGSSPLSYQWRQADGSVLSSTSNSITFPSASSSTATSYTVTVSNSAGSAISNPATITVNPLPANTPPTLTTTPSNRTVTAGSSTTFTVIATGSPTLTYQWVKDGVPIVGATDYFYTIPSVATGDAGIYTVTVTNGGGSVTTNPATLTVNLPPPPPPTNAPPTITTQPIDAIFHNGFYYPNNQGGSYFFVVQATGTAPFSYQWRKNGVNISGATAYGLTFLAALSPSDDADYSVVVSNSFGSETSQAAHLTVSVDPAITTQPASQSVTTGSSVTFTVAASGGPLSYQWRKGGTAIGGATNPSYTIPSAAANDAGDYAVTVSSPFAQVTSNAATLTVNAPLPAPSIPPPAISTQPASQTVTTGQSVTFVAAASGSGLAYQWQKDSVNIIGATSTSYTIPSAATGDTGTYRVIVTNSAGSVASDLAILTVNAPPPTITPPSITTQPANQAVTAGQSVTFTVAALGSGLSYQWQKDGSAISGATSFSYALPSAATSDAGGYTVVVSNSAGSITSSLATLTVNAASAPSAPPVPAPVISTHPASQTVTTGQSVTFTAAASGSGLSYEWRRNGTAITSATNPSYNIPSVATGDTGDYTVVVTNPGGSVTSNAATLTVNAPAPSPSLSPPAISTQPSSQTVPAGQSVTFTVAATGSGLSYQWQKDGVAIASATSFSYNIPSVASSDAGGYTVVVSNSAGSVTSNLATLTVNTSAPTPTLSPPAIATHPASQTVPAGASVTFTVSASGPQLAYQWLRRGAPILGATNSSYTLTAVTTGDADDYAVAVSNSAGSVTSNTATLAVNALPAILGLPANGIVTAGHDVSFSAAVSSSASALRWQVSTNGETWTDLANDATYSGVSTNTLNVSGASSALNGYRYRLLASNSAGSTVSSFAMLTVSPPVLMSPHAVALDPSGNQWVSDSSTNTIQRITPAGQVSVFAGTSGQAGSSDGAGGLFRQPGKLVFDRSGNLYVADTGNSTIRRISAAGAVSTIAGSPSNQGYQDGVVSNAWFNAPAGLAIDSAGNLFVADTGNAVIRRIDVSGAVTTVAGSAGLRGSADGSGSAARFNMPTGLVVDSAGNLFVADTANQVIRRISASGAVSTWVGVAGISGALDGTGSDALFNMPMGLAIDGFGNVYVADTGNSTIRMIVPNGAVRTLAGLSTVSGLKDGNGMEAWFNMPRDLEYSNGVLTVVDYGNAAIRKVAVSGSVTTLPVSAASAPTPTPPPPPPPSPTTTPPPAPAASGGGGGGGGAPSLWLYGLLAALLAWRRWRSRAGPRQLPLLRL